MPKVEHENIDNLNAVLTVTLEKSDYESKFKTELNKYRKQANMKGFRKGKTPASVLKKMYGKGVLADVINEMLQQELYDYLTNNDIKILGQPLPSADQELQDFDLKTFRDYVFKFDLGLAPDFEVEGADENTTFEKMAVDPSEEMVDEDLQAARKRSGERKAVEEEIRDNDMVKLEIVELDGETPKEDGITSEFSLLIGQNTNEDLKKTLSEKKQGDKLKVDLLNVEEGRDEDYARKYYLNMDEEDERTFNNEFEATIAEVTRIAPAEMDQEFFDQNFGEGEVSSEEEAREKIRERITGFYNSQAEALMSRDIQEKLLELNPMEFPEGFLKRWMKSNNEEVEAEVIEKEYDHFEKNLQWSLIRNKLVERFGIEVGNEDLVEAARNRIRQYFGGQSMPGMEQIVDSTAQRILQDQKQVEQLYEEVLTDRTFDALIKNVKVAEKKVSLEVFEEAVKAAQAANAPAALAEEEE
ncbi:MAG: trigger factor [Phaeodactylibacter sp.]|uniref:trigger factor n=1 Tax=Phaeodactylibacter sp. TaxID=1940289 RepID=UPI0032EF7D6F